MATALARVESPLESRPLGVLSPRAARFYHPELDCLRFVAFFGVFVHHTLSGEPAYYAAHGVPLASVVAAAVSGGRFGVDLFFVLSAYLITELLLREKERTGKVDLRSFYIRRILRIWPLYFLGIGIAALLPLFDSSQTFTLKYALVFVFMGGNWLTSLAGGLNSVMVILWSVSLEEQFYLLWPALLRVMRRPVALLCASATLLALCTAARFALLGYARGPEIAVLLGRVTRLDPLALGIAAAVLLHGRHLRLTWFLRVGCLAVGLGTMLLAAHYFGAAPAFLLIGYPAAALAALLIFLAVFQLPMGFPGWLRYLGKISYGLYVFHLLALYLVAKMFGGSVHDVSHFIPYWLSGLALTFVIAALSYRFFESPFLRLKEKYAYVKSRPV